MGNIKSVASEPDCLRRYSLCSQNEPGRSETTFRGIQKNASREDYHFFVAPGAGFEPATNWLTANCSTTELPRNGTILSRLRWQAHALYACPN